MCLFSGRGYWQELIESIVWAHNKLKVAPVIQPRALSITQGRAVGVAHYLLGGIATTWSFFSSTYYFCWLIFFYFFHYYGNEISKF
jgi:photosystem I P700 chlorophyll a apoprotein A1